MALVFLVRDLYLEKELALKLVRGPPPTAEDLEQVKREFALLAEMEHPGIARAHDFGYLGGRPYFTSEFIPGEPLSARKRNLDVSEFLRLARDLAEAVAFLHRAGILHLDIKPSNIILSSAPGRARAVLIDFGLFRRGFAGTPGKKIRGSLPYMAPEYFGGGTIGPWTDVYALGVTLYRVITGTFPRAGPGAEGPRLENERAWEPAPRPPSELHPPCPEDLDKVILKCLALEPGARFPSGRELLAALERIGGSGASEAQPGAVIPVTLGREAELAQAERFLDGLVHRREGPATLFVTGPPGIGQTHFLRALKIRAQTQGLRFYLETGYPGRTSPPGSLLQPLSAHLSADARARWGAFLSRLRGPRRPVRSDITEGERRLRRAAEVSLAASSLVEPVILAVDGLQHWDEISIQLLTDLIRLLGEKRAPERPPLGIVAAFREEGTSAPLLEELVEYVFQPGKASVIALGPLGPTETLALHRARGGKEGEGDRGLSIFQQTGGYPARIAALVPAPPPSGARQKGGPDEIGGGGVPAKRWLAGLGAQSRNVCLALVFLDRPAGAGEIAAITGLRRARVDRALADLERARLVARLDKGPDGEEWLPEPRARSLGALLPPAVKLWNHRRIAARLAERAASSADVRFVEAFHHYRRAGDRRNTVTLGLRAARSLKASFQHRAALDIFRAVLDALPVQRKAARLETAIEIADLHARIGDTDVEEGIRILREILPQSRRVPGAAARVLLHLATLHSRRGDFRRAEALFNEGLGEAAGHQGGRLKREELLLFTNEHAAMKAAVGEYAAARDLCEKGFRLAGRSRDPEIREIVANLLATRANVSLRTYDFEAAVRDLEKGVEIAESIGTPGNQATLLNNLGVVLIQCDRYGDAIQAFREAERICLRLDEGPSLVSILGNLAILHAKTGDFASMEKALADGQKLIPSVIGRRREFFLMHSRGVSLLGRGRYAEGRAQLDEAIRLGEQIGDRHVVAFDEIYRAEALIFEAAYVDARREFLRLSEPGSSDRIRKMAISRNALVEAILGRTAEVEVAAKKYAEIAAPSVPFLDAWDGLFFGWAFSLAGDRRRSLEFLAPAEKLFRSRGLGPALSLLVWVKAEGHFLEGDLAAAEETLAADGLRGSPSHPRGIPGNDLTAVLWPLLSARILLERPAGQAERARCADLLAEAGAALVGNLLPEWSARLEVLRAFLSPRGDPRRLARRKRREIAGDMPEDLRRTYLSSAAWKRWTALRGQFPAQPAGTAPREAGEGSSTTKTLKVQGGGGASSRARLVARSPRMRKILSILDRLKGSELPLLIRGETGTGKELVGRIIQEESKRWKGPFHVVDCATIPPALFETELFGARAGAYTGIERDRPGLLELAAGGTVMFDEIAGVPLEVQAKFLRVLSEGVVRPVGAEREKKIDVRFIFSTSRDLEAETRDGRFRRDLLHRIRVVTIEVPPLRERPEDFEELVSTLVAEGGGERPSISRSAIEKLRAMDWPGNVRELRNVLARLSIENPEGITGEAVDRGMAEPRTTTIFPRNLLSSEALPELKEQLERDFLSYHYRRLGCDARALAQMLGLKRRQLYRRCARLGLALGKLKGKRG